MKRTTYSEGYPICPYCNYKDMEWHEGFSPTYNTQIYTCANCNKGFIVETEQSINWTCMTAESQLKRYQDLADHCVEHNYQSQIEYYKKKVEEYSAIVEKNSEKEKVEK